MHDKRQAEEQQGHRQSFRVIPTVGRDIERMAAEQHCAHEGRAVVGKPPQDVVQEVESNQKHTPMKKDDGSHLSQKTNQHIARDNPGHPFTGVIRKQVLKTRKVPELSEVEPRIHVAHALKQPVRIDERENGGNEKDGEIVPTRRHL